MKKAGFILLAVIGLFSCRDNKVPDVSGIDIPLQTQHFEQDFFALDTTNMMASLEALSVKYPFFLGDYLHNILELPEISDTSVTTLQLIKRFIAEYRPVKDSADKVLKEWDDIQTDIRKGLQFVKHYFPAYKAPAKVITFIGPMEGYSDVITRDALAVGLQLHLGSQFSMYTSEVGQSLYPTYISRRFTPDYIPVNCMKNIIDDISPEQTTGKPLVEQMVEKGKRLYVLDKLMPYTADTLKLGYTKKQLDGCFENEGRIWNFFLTNNLLLTTEPALLKGYMTDAPNTPELGNQSPGAIGLFVGRQIVRKYMDKHGDLSLAELLQTNATKIFEESKYRPK
jgi:hypothetical protein